METLSEGKTKIIYATGENQIVMQSKDDITSGDGAKRDMIQGKGAIATKTTANVFSLLNQGGIPTHFLAQVDNTRLLCVQCDMIPLEVTIRGTTAGHYIRRNPGSVEGEDLAGLPVEFTFKDDANHDPFVVITREGSWNLHDPEKPVSDDTLIGGTEPLLSPTEVRAIETTARDVFRTLKKAWAKLDVKLVDLKIEFGRTMDGHLVVGDVIDNDSWRLWPDGDKSRQLDKQIYREGGTLQEVLDKYQRVMVLTDDF